MVAAWLAEGAVARWRGPVGTLRDGAFAPDASQERFVAPGGMRRLAQHLANQATKSGARACPMRAHTVCLPSQLQDV